MKLFWVDNKQEYQETTVYEDDNINNNFTEEEYWQIAVDIIENPNELIIVSPIAWVDLEDIDVSIKDWVLILSWERKKPIELYLHWSLLRINEVFWGNFKRTIILPENLDLDNIKAILEKNILIIKIPKIKFNTNSIKIEKVDNIF
jgi:HSP20 family protein